MNDKDEKYINILTEIALGQEEDEEIDAMIRVADHDLPTVSYEHKEQIWRQFQKSQKRANRDNRGALRILRIAADAAACLIVLLTISVTVAAANSEWVRSNVYRLLMQPANKGTTVQMIIDEEAAFYVPSYWMGGYYPSSVPEGFRPAALTDNTGTSLEMWDQNRRMLIIEENLPQKIAWIDTDGAEVSSTIINGHPTYIFEKTQFAEQYSCTIVIDLEDRYYVISALGISRAEMMEIASSVRHVIVR